jgi:hypothetical protein
MTSSTSLPALFDRIPPGLFGPLGGSLAPLYWELLVRFYQHEFEGEPAMLDRNSALLHAEQVLRDSVQWRERKAELLAETNEVSEASPMETALDEGSELRDAARRLVLRLERSGWIHFEYRSREGQVLNFFPYAARLVDTLLRVARDEQPVFQGYAHSIASALRRESFAHRPGVALMEAKRHTLDLTRELKILSQNIQSFIQRLFTEARTAQHVLAESIDHYKSAVLANYHRMKTVDNLYKWRDEILARVDGILCEEATLQVAARFYAEQLGADTDSAYSAVVQDLRLLRAQFETLPLLTEEIDARNARFSGVALRKLMYLLRQDRRIEGQLQFLIDQLVADGCPDLEFDIYSCELLNDGFLYTPPKRRTPPPMQPLLAKTKADEAALRKRILPRLTNPYARSRIEQYVLGLLSANAALPTTDVEVAEDADYVRMIHILSYGLDGKSPYRYSPEHPASAPKGAPIPQEQRGNYGIPRGLLSRAATKKR